MLMPRVRVRVRPRCDDDCCERPSMLSHPLVVALATVGAQVIGELAIKRWAPDEEREAPPAKAPRAKR